MAAIKTLVFIVVVTGFAIVVIPIFLAGLPLPWSALKLGIFRFTGIIPIIAGSFLYLWCAFDFTFTGKGTPVPIDPPKKLVVNGAYRFVRNPMYIGIMMILIGESVLFESAVLLLYGIACFAGFCLFVGFYEEPVLKRKFNRSYIDYCHNVPGWIPKIFNKKKRQD